MASPFTSPKFQHFEVDIAQINAFIALDSSSNVLGYYPTAPGGVTTGSYSRVKGLGLALGPAGAVITQPHTATGTYIFTLDEPWFSLVNADVQLIDQGAVAGVNAYVDANVTNWTSGYGYMPGQNMSLSPREVRVLFRAASNGALTNPVASTGFWLNLTLKRTGVL